MCLSMCFMIILDYSMLLHVRRQFNSLLISFYYQTSLTLCLFCTWNIFGIWKSTLSCKNCICCNTHTKPDCNLSTVKIAKKLQNTVTYWILNVPWDQWEVQLKSLHLFATPNWFWLNYWLLRWLQLHLRHPPAKSRGFPSPPVSGAGKIISWQNTLRPLTSFEETDVCVGFVRWCVCFLSGIRKAGWVISGCCSGITTHTAPRINENKVKDPLLRNETESPATKIVHLVIFLWLFSCVFPCAWVSTLVKANSCC